MKKSKLITMAISLLAAICLWIYVVTVVNPEGTTTISNIPVTFSGAEVLREDQGLVLSGDYQDMVTVSFTGRSTAMTRAAFSFRSSRRQCSRKSYSTVEGTFATPMRSQKLRMDLAV